MNKNIKLIFKAVKEILILAGMSFESNIPLMIYLIVLIIRKKTPGNELIIFMICTMGIMLRKVNENKEIKLLKELK